MVLTVLARVKQQADMLTDVFLAPELAHNIMQYDMLVREGLKLVFDEATYVQARRRNSEVALKVSMKLNVLYVRTVE